MEQNLQDLRISGAGSASGGRFNEVKISGAGEVKGDIECNFFKTSGASEVKGNVKSKTVEVSGASEIKGSLECEEMTTSGSSEIKGDVKANKLKVSGSSDIDGSLHAENIEVLGCVDIKKDCEAEVFTARGAFDIGGLLNADTITINVGGKCSAKEIGGEHIDVRIGFGDNLFSKMLNYFSVTTKKLQTEQIEGDNIYLEATCAKMVRGSNITIGAECTIDRVEYKDTLNIVDGAVVKEQIKL